MIDRICYRIGVGILAVCVVLVAVIVLYVGGSFIYQVLLLPTDIILFIGIITALALLAAYIIGHFLESDL